MMDASAKISNALPIAFIPESRPSTPPATKSHNHHSLNMLNLPLVDFPSGFIKLAAKTGLKTNATIKDANKVKIKMVGK